MHVIYFYEYKSTHKIFKFIHREISMIYCSVVHIQLKMASDHFSHTKKFSWERIPLNHVSPPHLFIHLFTPVQQMENNIKLTGFQER